MKGKIDPSSNTFKYKSGMKTILTSVARGTTGEYIAFCNGEIRFVENGVIWVDAKEHNNDKTVFEFISHTDLPAAKADENKSDEKKSDEKKNDNKKDSGKKAEDTMKDDKISQETKPTENKSDVGEPCVAPAGTEDKKSDEKPAEEAKTDSKKDETKKEDTKKDSSKKNDTRKDDAKNDSSKKNDSKKESKHEKSGHNDSSKKDLVDYIEYGDKKTTVKIEVKDLDHLHITVIYKKSSNKVYVYKMSGKFNESTLSVRYKDCKMTEITYKHGKPVSEKVLVKNGTGRIEFSKHENKISWIDDNAKYAKKKAFAFKSYNK